MDKLKIPDKLYDVLKWVTIVALPATGTLYFTIAQICGLPYGEQVVGILTAVETFIGTLIGLSTYAYNKSKIEDKEDE